MKEINDYIGDRLYQIRMQLSADTGIKWTLQAVGKEIGTTYNVVHRAEAGLGTNYQIVKLLNFYYDMGSFNMNWALRRDNSDIPMYVEKKKTQEEIQRNIKRIKQEVGDPF